MSDSFPKCNQAGIEFVISTNDSLQENVLFLSDHFPVAMYTQHYSHAASDYVPPHWHNEMQLIWVSEGKLAYSVNGDSFDLDSSRILIISGRQLHSSRTVRGDVETLCINFRPEIFHPLVLEHCLAPLLDSPSFSYTLFPLQPYQAARMNELIHAQTTTLRYFSIMNFISQIFEEILDQNEKASAPTDRQEAELFHDILNYVHSHYSEPVTVKEITEQALINKNKLTVLFHKYTAMSPIRYLNEYRLYQAKNLLLSTDQSVSEISEAVGYHQVSHFIRQFRGSYGLSPLKYRKRYGKK
ncbi:MAG: AraC family transcriptional regulator [Clostridiales bacterium]|nr:AraC family transcriptional regulator [Clostridiales bacterium]